MRKRRFASYPANGLGLDPRRPPWPFESARQRGGRRRAQPLLARLLIVKRSALVHVEETVTHCALPVDARLHFAEELLGGPP